MTDTSSESYRHACEVRFVVRMFREKGRDSVRDYLAGCAKHRPADQVDRLRVAALAAVKGIKP